MDTKEQIDTLIELQRIETEKDVVRARIQEVSGKMRTLEDQLRACENRLDIQETSLEEARKLYRSLEMESKESLTLIHKSRDRLRSVKTNKEYQALLKAIEELKAKNSQAEDQMLEHLDRIESLEQEISTQTEELDALKDQYTARKASFEETTTEGEKRLAELDSDWGTVSGKMDRRILDRFVRIKEQLGGQAIAPAKNAVCYGCHTNIPPQMYNELQRYENLRFCPNCQRIIYPDNDREE